MAPKFASKRPLPFDGKNTLCRDSSSIISSIEFAIELNNESASLLCSGEDAKAVSKLSESLTSMRHLIASKGQQAGCTSMNQEQQEEEQCSMPALPSSLQVAVLRDSDYFIFSRCMEIPSFHQRSTKNLSLYSACIVLNLALAYHQLGIKGHRCSLFKAEKLYCMAMQLLTGPPFSTNALSLDEKTVLSMRIFAVNNLVQVYQEQCQFQKAKVVIKHLSVLLNKATSTGTFFRRDELRKFVLNASLWEPPQIAASA